MSKSTSRGSSSKRSSQLPWRSSSLSNKNSPTASLSFIVAVPEQVTPLRTSVTQLSPAETPSMSDSPPSPIPISIPINKCLSISSSEGSPPPFASAIPNTPPSITPTYISTSPTENPATLSVEDKPAISSPPPSPDHFLTSPPPPPTTPPPHQGTSNPKTSSLQPMTALNSSPTRFTLSIPLLGRAKVPLDSVLESKKTKVPVVVDKASDNSKGVCSQIQAVPAPDLSTAPSTSATLSSSSPLVSPSSSPPTSLTIPNSSDGVANSPSNSQVETTTTSGSVNLNTIDTTRSDKPHDSTSWWNYVGWSSTPPAATAIVSIEPPATDNQEVKPETPSTEVALIGEADAHFSTTAASADTVISPDPAVMEGVEDGVRSDDKLPTSPSSPMWYTPWSWYSKPNTTTTTNEPVQPESEELMKTASEDIQVDAPLPVVQDQEPEPVSTSSSETPVSAPAPVNPITTSMEVNWSGWASFFSSRTLMVKTIGNGTHSSGGGGDVKRDEDGMEVMDIDGYDEQQQQQGDGGGKDLLLKDSGKVLSTTPHNGIITNTKPLLLKTTRSRDSDSLQVELHSSDGKGLRSPSTQPSVSSTPKKGNSGSNTPLHLPLPPSPSPSSREKSQPQTPSNTSALPKQTNNQRTASPAPSKKSITSPPPPPPPNLVLPTWQHTFHTGPRNVVPVTAKSLDDPGVGGNLLGKTMKFVSGMLFAKDANNDGSLQSGSRKMKGKEKEMGSDRGGEAFFDRRVEEERFKEFGKELPRTWQILEEAGLDTDTTSTPTTLDHIPSFGLCSPESKKKGSTNTKSQVGGSGGGGVQDESEDGRHGMKDVLRGCKNVVIIGIHGWFPGAMIRTVVGEPTGTSTKFANMTEQALLQFEDEHGVKLEKITKIPLEGDGTIDKRVERLYNNLKANEDWMTDLHEADAIIVSTHSQGSIVSTHLLDRLIRDNHITTTRSTSSHQLMMGFGSGAAEISFPSAIGVPEGIAGRRRRKVQRVCCVALCGIHLGPLRYLSSSTLVGPYLQYFESTAARELFEFQNTESAVSKAYMQALQNILDHGIKMLYIASLNDQVVPLYSGLFTAVSHPLILRALYIDGDAYHSSDFLSNLLVLLLRILNSGISDSGLIAHLSEATAGSLIGVGHSTAYEELSTFSLAVKYLFLVNEGISESTQLHVESFNASQEQNDYEIPWSLRDIIADERVSHFFSRDISELRDAFREWHPKTSILRDLKRKLQPITRLPSSSTFNSLGSGLSKL